MVEEVEGIILRETPYGETSKIIQVLTKDRGMIGIMAKGAKSLKSPFRSSTLKLNHAIFQIYYKEGKLSTLSSVDVLDHYQKTRKDIIKISYASFLLELSEQVMKHNPHPDIYKLLLSGLSKIEEGFTPMVITNIIELKYLEYLGVMPVIDGCCVCGRTDHIETLSSYLGGYVCSECRKNEPIVDGKVIKLLRMYYYVDIEKISKLEIDDKVVSTLNQFIDDYYDRYTGLYLKSKDFIKTLSKVQ